MNRKRFRKRFRRRSQEEKERELARLPLILLVGTPNVGKSTIFNQITQKYSITANYLFTTLEANSDIIEINNKRYEIIDTPGIYSLDHPSEEGQITRDLLFSPREKIVIQVSEASKIEQSLQLTAQLLELQVPLILVLNMIDELVKHGVRINARALSEQLDVPVIETIATERKGIDSIKKYFGNLKMPRQVSGYPWILRKFYQELNELLPDHTSVPVALFSLIALDDPYAFHWLKKNFNGKIAKKIVDYKSQFEKKHTVNLPILLLNARHVWVDKVSGHSLSRREEISKYGIQSFGTLSRHPIYGWFILSAIILLTYLIVGKFGATYLVVQLEVHVFSPFIALLGSISMPDFLQRFLIGDYGILTIGLLNAIGTVLPIISLFFLVLNILEDTGYLTNLIILTSRVFKKIGLSGKSILPIVLGFGCKTMATLSTRILDSKKEKYIAIFLIGLAIPCSSQMSINLAILSRQPLIAFGIVLFILVAIEILSGLILNKIIPEKQQSDFIIEIPPIRIPDFALTLKKTGYRTLWFLKEAVPLFLLGALVLFILDETNLLILVERALSPVIVGWLDLPANFAEAMVMSLARSEAGAAIVLNFVVNGAFSTRQTITAIIVLTLFIPCISNVFAIIKELKPKAATLMIIVITITSLTIGGLVSKLLQFLNYGG